MYARRSTYGPSYGAERFSLLHLHAEGVAVYDALYRGNAAQARFLAIIQPGEGYGDNWTRFTEPGNFLHQLVMGHPEGPPAYLVYESEREKACWPEFDHLAQERKIPSGRSFTNLQLWSRLVQTMGDE